MRRRSLPIWLVLTATLVLMASVVTQARAKPHAAEASVTAAWEAVRARGGYRFSAAVRQTTSPRAAVVNVGRQARTDTVHLEGSADFEAQEMAFTLWSQGGNVLDRDSGAQVRIDESGAYARQGRAAWEPVPDFSGTFAPDGDFLAYLDGARGIREVEQGSQGGVAYTRYAFELNGAALATRLRDQLERQMTARGELPAGLSLAVPELYANMKGSGELWVDVEGLPLRQRLSLQFPESDTERVATDVDVSFSGFGATTAGAWGGVAGRLRSVLADRDVLQAVASHAGFLVLAAGILALLISRRTRRLSSAVTVACLITLVFTPVLQAVQAARAERTLRARQALQEAATEESEMQRRMRAFFTEPGAESAPLTTGAQVETWAQPPDADPLRVPTLQDGDPLDELNLDAAASQTDSDRDGLTDYQESLLGTSPFRADSDGDLLPDTLEVEGFTYDGRRWVSDPLELDSNRDGLSDTREWLADVDGDGIPDDTDGDGAPDLFDRDNDGDGVPDRLDISPFAVSASFAEDDPLGLTFSNLAAGRPALVDFQLRPTDADHLWYAFNVLDWPEGDAEGQMQDVDGKTFADVSSRELMGQEANGDLRLVPMLEIEINGPLTHLPTTLEQRQMGMVVQTPRDEQGRVRADRPTYVYLPLRLVTDPDSGAQVAFEGTMLYRPEFDLWGSAHRARLAWLVQALVDVCVGAGANETGCDEMQNNQSQVLHVYYEPWQLTGLDVREDHGVELAILYEDPAVDPEPHDDDALMMLAGGLAQTFLAGRDTNEDGQPDLTPDEIARRFAQGAAETCDEPCSERWAIPDIVDVTRRSYEHRAEALATIVMTDTVGILTRTFSPHVESQGAISPTLMFAREERFRAVNLDSQLGSELVRWRASNLTVDLDPGDVPLQTVAGLSWAPFRYNDEGRRWASFAIADYWDLLAERYPFVEEADPETAAGKQFGLQLLYLSLYAGVSETIQFDGAIPPDLRAETDRALTATILDHILNGVSYVVNGYVAFLLDVGSTLDGFTWRDWAKVKELVTQTDRELGLLVGNLKAKFQTLSTFGKGAVIAALILLLAGLILLTVFAFITESLAARITLASVLGLLLVWLDVISPIYTVIQGIRGVAETGFLSATRAWLASSSGQSAVNAAKFAAVLALVITLVVVWIDFFVTISRHDFQAGSIPFNLLLSQAIAGTLVAAVALALVFALPVVGAIIVAVIGIWDLIMTIVGLDNLVLTNLVTKFLADVFYGVNATIEEPEVTLQDRQLSLVDPQRGLVAGNALSVSASVLTEIEHNAPRHNVLAYLNSFYTHDYLASTIFDYRLNRRGEGDSRAWSAPRPWQLRRNNQHLGHWLWRGERTSVAPAVSLSLEGAGINQVMPYTFSVRYDLPGWECWGVSALAYCDERRIAGENSTVDATIVLDVFPATLDAFYALDWGAWQPAWECPPLLAVGDYAYWLALDGRCDQGLSFPVQRDHDGDGLLAQAVGGMDPDDSRWDTDGDGLSDRFEMELAEQGQGMALHLTADSDGDGLCDDQERLWGSDPGLADSDGDGLLDGEEVFHQDRCDGDGDGDTTEWLGGWTFVYDVARDHASQAGSTRVSSNPRQADSDGDGLNDLAEKQLHERNPLLYPYHPAVYNETPVALYSTLSDGDRVLAPGQTAAYTATVRNTLSIPLSSSGALTITLPGDLGGERLTTPFTLYQMQEETVTQPVQVAPGAASGQADIAQVVTARLHGDNRNPLFTWLPPQHASHTLAGDLPVVSATAAVPGRSRPSAQLVAVLRGQDEPGPCGGDVACSTAAIELLFVNDTGDISGTVTLDSFQDFDATVAGKEPDLAFNEEGAGLLVYVRPTCEGESCRPTPTVMGALLAPGLAPEPARFPISTAGGEDPTAGVENVRVASDGVGFLVLWEETDEGGQRAIRAARVGADGLVSPLQTLPVLTSETLLDVAWNGESYLLAWSVAVAEEGHALRLATLDGAEQLQIGAAHEPASSLPGEESLAPQIAYDPASRSWLLSWLATGEGGDVALHYRALDADGRPRLARQEAPLSITAAGVALTCGEQGTGCLAATYGATGLELVSLALDPLATAIDRPLPILIDADPPTSTITSLQSGQYISTTGDLVIGGLAADPTSRIAGVDVRLNDEPCRDVVGTGVWAATCRVPDVDGPFTITAQAADLVGNRERQASRLTVIVDRGPPQVSAAQAGAGQVIAAQAAGAQEAGAGADLWLLQLEGEAFDPAAGAAPGSGLARVEARLAWERSWQPAEIAGNVWRLDYRLPRFDASFNVLSDPSGSYTFALRAFDNAGNMMVLRDLPVRVDNRPPVATLTHPAETDRVISQTLALSGRLTETGQIQSGLSDLAFALTGAGFVVSPTTWLPAELAQRGPGVISSTWRASVPPDLEGIYQLDVRGTDVLGNGNDDRSTWNQWQGEIDTLAPRTAVTVTYSGAGSSAQTLYQFRAEDFNLASTTFEPACPAAAVTYETYSEAWWDETIGDRTRIDSMAASCRVTGFQTGGATVEACDRFGRCTSDAALPPTAFQGPLLYSAILTPTQHTVLADDAPVELTVGAHAVGGLRAATVLIDGALLARRQWADGPIDARWTTSWQPPGEGLFALTSIVTDTVGRVQTDTVSTSVSVDLSPPQISLATTVVTATQRLAAGRVDLTGSVRDAGGVATVEVQIDGGPWLPAVLHGEEWIFPWQVGADLDGQDFAVAVRATDGAGRMDEVRHRVVVDVLPPDAVNVELAVVEAGASRILAPGDTVREAPALLAIRWAADDDDDVAAYLAGWSEDAAADAATLTPYTGPDRHEQVVGEPRAVYAHLVVRDEHGNTTMQRLGPIVVDGAGTPDYVADVTYDGWQDEATNLVGVDWAMARRAATGAALTTAQRLFASWDAAGLRLTWTGAQWNRDGDLFVYLDTDGAAGGAGELYNPYRGPNPTIALPEEMAADYVVQIEDSRSAILRRWDGDAWVTSADLSGVLFLHDTVARPARTDLYLPFDLLDIDDAGATDLKLLAVASEEEALRLWATIPDKNPLNSEQAIVATAAPFTGDDFRLTQMLRWPALGEEQTPNGGLRPGADLQLSIAANPPGTALTYLHSGLPQLRPGALLDERLDGRLDASLPLDTDPTPLPDGSVVTYTIAYANRGEATARAVQLEVGGHGALLLPDTAPELIALGDVEPGITGTVVLTASVNVSRTQNIASAELDVTVSDQTHGAFDWLWVQHDVDASPPVVSVTAPQGPVTLGPLVFAGAVEGPATVASVTVAIQTWSGNAQALSFCTEAVIARGRWSCAWEPGEEEMEELAATVFDGAELVVQARATDVFDRRSDWTSPLTVVIDQEPPLLVLSDETSAYLADGFLNAAELNLTGVISDSRQAGQLEVCVEDDPCRRVETMAGAWHVPVAASEDMDGRTQSMTLQGFDFAGNASESVTLDYRIDVRPPVLSVTGQLTTTGQSPTMTAVLSGTVREGAGPPTVTVRIAPPSGATRLAPIVVDDQSWRVALAPDVAGDYRLIVEAEDRAGNVRVMPAVSLDVTPAAAPPGLERPLPRFSTHISNEFVPFLTSGAFIRLIVEPAPPTLWSQVQWRDASGIWRDVDGWRGSYYRNNEVLWWVSEKELGTGPYRWALYEGPGGHLLAFSAPFMAPEQSGASATMRLMPAGVGSGE